MTTGLIEPPAKKTAAKKTTTRRKSTAKKQTTAAPETSSRRLPQVGKLVSYDAIDPLTGDQMTGVGVVVKSYSQGEGDDQIHRVDIAQLPATHNLSADDVNSVSTA